MTNEEAEREFDAAPAIPMTEAEIQDTVKFATDPQYRRLATKYLKLRWLAEKPERSCVENQRDRRPSLSHVRPTN